MTLDIARPASNDSIAKVLNICEIPDDTLQAGMWVILNKYRLKANLVVDNVSPDKPSYQMTLRRNADTPLEFAEAEHVFDEDVALRGVYLNTLRWLADLFKDDPDLEAFRGIRI